MEAMATAVEHLLRWCSGSTSLVQAERMIGRRSGCGTSLRDSTEAMTPKRPLRRCNDGAVAYASRMDGA